MFAAREESTISASDVAKYFLYRSTIDGDLITPLKMQKLVYLAYAKTLAKKKEKLFKDKIEAWPMGPVVNQLYKELNKYGSSPIESDYIDVETPEEIENKFPEDIKEVIDDVYEEYIVKSAFELVSLVHDDEAWKKARKGLAPDESSNNTISDEDIILEYDS